MAGAALAAGGGLGGTVPVQAAVVKGVLAVLLKQTQLLNLDQKNG